MPFNCDGKPVKLEAMNTVVCGKNGHPARGRAANGRLLRAWQCRKVVNGRAVLGAGY
jgi:hypothetical protein